LKKYTENEIKKVRSGLGQSTLFKFTRNIDNILEQYACFLEDKECGRIKQLLEGSDVFEKHKTTKADFEDELKMQIPPDYKIRLLPFFYNTLDLEKNADSVVRLAIDEISESKAKDV
jgi:hypothetical protein